jgi:flagellar basal-body rod modification protein FlgD
MSSTTPTGNALGVSSTQSSSSSSAVNPMGQLGKDDFLKLLATELQNQDPANPLDDKEYMGQLAQFATLEQITNVSAGLDKLTYGAQVSQSLGLIGRTVQYVRSDGSSGSGVPDSITLDNGSILINVGSDQITPSDVVGVGAASDGTADALSSLEKTLATLGQNSGSGTSGSDGSSSSDASSSSDGTSSSDGASSSDGSAGS